jgi:hypothetical protein
MNHKLIQVTASGCLRSSKLAACQQHGVNLLAFAPFENNFCASVTQL